MWVPLAVFVATLDATLRACSRTCAPTRFLYDFSGKRTLPGGRRRRGLRPTGAYVKLHCGPWVVALPCVFEHSARGVPAQPQGEVSFSNFSPKFPYRNL